MYSISSGGDRDLEPPSHDLEPSLRDFELRHVPDAVEHLERPVRSKARDGFGGRERHEAIGASLDEQTRRAELADDLVDPLRAEVGSHERSGGSEKGRVR